MSNITQFTKSTVQTTRDEINNLLAQLSEKGLEIKLGNISFDDDSFTSKITCKLKGAVSEYEKTFNRSYESVGYANAITKTFILNNKKYTFLGFKPRASKKKAFFTDGSENFVCSFERIKSQLTD
jgi:hypothetical protein